jgi:Nif-specific regulatory protein
MLGRYEIQEIFSEGAQSRLYTAHDKITGEVCLLKSGPTIKDEALLALELNHPYIARPYDFGTLPDIGTYAAYPKFTEPDIRRWSKDHPKDEEFQRVILQIAEFLGFLHHRGWLYHDFKPEHFLVASDRIRVLDLGLSTRINQSGSLNTFSGTFPYISPERLIGRPTDHRSDIFAFGMMLSHLFFPEEDWSVEPSISALQQLQKKSHQLERFWSDLIGQMISLEPSQRPESVADIWRRLLPEQARGAFLIYPPIGTFTLEQDVLVKERALLVQSGSQTNLDDVVCQSIHRAWLAGWQTCSFDLRQVKGGDFLASSLSIMAGKSLEFFPALEFLQTLEQEKDTLLTFCYPETLDSRQRSLLSFAFSAFSRSKSFRILVTTSRSTSFEDLGFKKIEIPLLTRETLDEILHSILPSNGLPRTKLEKFRSSSFFTAEQVLSEFSKELPQGGFLCWPIAGRMAMKTPEIDKLSKIEMRTLICLALSKGSLKLEILAAVLRMNLNQVHELYQSLNNQGYIQQQNERIYLNLPIKSILERVRKDRAKEIAGNILRNWSDREDPLVHFELAKIAGQKRLAALIAIREARRMRIAQSQMEPSISWLWGAFSAGAVLPKQILQRLTLYCLRQAYMSRAKRLLDYQRKRFGFSYKLADLYLEYYHRRNSLNLAIKCLGRARRVAQAKKHSQRFQYFSVRLAGFLILEQRFDEAEKVFSEIRNSTVTSTNIQGLMFHFEGLSLFLRGKLKESIESFTKASGCRHSYRSFSYMNLGLALITVGEFIRGEKFCRKSIRFFSKLNDSDGLSRAYINLGVALLDRGKPNLARHYFQRCLNLSRAFRNIKLIVSSLNNLAETYKVEGRLDRAIRSHLKAGRIAAKSKLEAMAATNFSNAGVQLAVQGKFRSSLRLLRNAIAIQKSFPSKLDLAFTYENLGLTYVFSKHYSTALKHLNLSSRLFESLGSFSNFRRSQLYMALCLIQKGRSEDTEKILNAPFPFQEDSFEMGLYNYVCASYNLGSKDYSQKYCRDKLYLAEQVFRKIPNLFWLGKAYRLKAQYFIQTERFESASLALQSAYNIFSRVGAKKELFELGKMGLNMAIPENLLDRIAEKLPYKVLVMVKDVLSEGHPDSMISKILATSVEFTDMERAVLILSEDPPRIYKSTTLEEAAIQEICEISKSATEAASESPIPYIRLDASSDPDLKSKPSIIGNRIMSIVCLPLRAGEKTLGVLYLDSKERMEALATTETVLLEIFASIISLALNNTLVLEKSLAENEDLRESLGLSQFPEIIGTSEPMIEVFKTVHQLLDTEIPILITGDTGTGKELIARVLHFCGKRKNGPFVAVNCSALSKSLLESELFGHEKGSFTGAIQQKKGLFEEARHGTLFLDEIGDMPYSMQAKLLRVLQDGEFRRVGGNEVLQTDARVVLATNRNLQELVSANKFREDLYYRIKGIQIHLPSLKDRRQDIPLLASHFLKNAVTAARKKIVGYSPEALDLLKGYLWPGNVRQLKNEVERAVALTRNEWIQAEDLSPELRETIRAVPEEATLREAEKGLIVERLKHYKWNIFHTAKSLGLTRNGLYGKMKLHGIPRRLIE